MKENRALKVFVANGFFGLDTSYFASKYVMDHMGLDQSLRGNIYMSHYDAGHMMYSDMTSLKKLKIDVANFIRKAMSGAAND